MFGTVRRVVCGSSGEISVLVLATPPSELTFELRAAVPAAPSQCSSLCST